MVLPRNAGSLMSKINSTIPAPIDHSTGLERMSRSENRPLARLIPRLNWNRETVANTATAATRPSAPKANMVSGMPMLPEFGNIIAAK